jgi:hypothetical protein
LLQGDNVPDLLEAKGESYEQFKDGSGGWKTWYRGANAITRHMGRQRNVATALGSKVEWYFAEKPVADFFRVEFAKEELTNIIVFDRPYIPGRYKPKE